MTKLISIVAIAKNNVIANNGNIPWNYPIDKQQYKAKVRTNPIVIGRKTYETMMKYEPALLKQSSLIVLTRNTEYETNHPNHTVGNSKKEAVDWIENQNNPVYNLGGGEIYKMLFERTDQLIVSHIPETPEGTVVFPSIEESKWTVISIENFSNFTVKTYERIT